MQAFYAQLLGGLINASFYALLTPGLASIFRALHLINFPAESLYTTAACCAASRRVEGGREAGFTVPAGLSRLGRGVLADRVPVDLVPDRADPARRQSAGRH